MSNKAKQVIEMFDSNESSLDECIFELNNLQSEDLAELATLDPMLIALLENPSEDLIIKAITADPRVMIYFDDLSKDSLLLAVTLQPELISSVDSDRLEELNCLRGIIT